LVWCFNPMQWHKRRLLKVHSSNEAQEWEKPLFCIFWQCTW